MEVEQVKEIADSALELLTRELERGKSTTLKAYLVAMARFPRYSARNTLLITSQNPGATRVAGFHTWRKLGPQVRRAEHGIAILAPILYRRALRDPVRRRGIKLTYTPMIEPAFGLSKPGEIQLRPSLPPADEFSTLVHELAHATVHHNEAAADFNPMVRETEAEAVAFVACYAIGLDTNNASSDCIQLYDGNARTIAASLERIRTTAAGIITGIQVKRSRVGSVPKLPSNDRRGGR